MTEMKRDIKRRKQVIIRRKEERKGNDEEAGEMVAQSLKAPQDQSPVPSTISGS